MRILLPALTLALAGTAAQAADHGFYLGVSVSQVKLDNVGEDFGTGDLDNFNFDLDDTSWKLVAGFRPLDHFSVELNYIDLGKESRSFAGSQFRVDGKAYGAFVLGFLPVGPVDLFAKGGLVRWETDARGPLGFRFDDDGTEFGYGAGVQVRLGSLAARLEYEQFDVDNTDGVELLSLGATWTFL